MQQKNRLIFNRLICDNSKKIDWYLDATNRTWKFRENWVIISRSAKVHRNFWKFLTIRFLLQGRKSTSFQPKRLLNLILSDWDHAGRNHASTNVETWLWKPRWLRIQPSVRLRTSKFWYKYQIKNFSNEPFSTIIERSTDTLMGETKRVATQNSKFEDSVNSVRKSFFGTFVQPGFWCNKETDSFSIDWFVTTPKKNDWNLDATNRTWKFRENWVRISRSAKTHRNFWNFGPSGFCCKEENRLLSNLNVCSI